MEKMPIWCPPTPPQNGEDIYIDYSLTLMYDLEPIPESELPPVYVKKDYKRPRNDSGYLLDGNRRPAKIRREEIFCAPRSLFDRPSVALARIRRDLKNQRYRGIFKPNIQIPGLKPPLPQKILVEPEGMAEWSVFEDIAILHVLINLQGLPCNLMLLSPGHTPNWDLVAEIVNSCSKTYRSPRQCRWRYETVIQSREEGKLVESPKKQKKSKSAIKLEYIKGPLRCLRTTQLYANDNNSSFTKTMRGRFDCFKAAYLKKAPPPKRHFSTPSLMNPKHMEVLQEFGVVNYDQPITPQAIAVIRSNKLREKQRVSCPPLPPPVSHTNGTAGVSTSIGLQQSQTVNTPISVIQQCQQQTLQQQQLQELVHQQHSVAGSVALHSQQVQIQHITPTVVQQSQHAAATAIVLQHTSGATGVSQSSHVPQVSLTGIQQGASQTHLIGRHSIASTPQSAKAIATPSSTLITAGQVQKLQHQNTSANSNSQQTSHLQLQQQTVNNLASTPSSVSVVLTTPVQTLSSNIRNQSQHHVTLQGNSCTAQILPLTSQQQHQQHGIASSSPQVGGIVHTQSLPQVVSVSQLATVGTVLTTSSNLCQPTGSVTTLNTSALRTQRIVATPVGTTTLQDVVLQQRTGSNPSPTIVSMANVGSNVTQAQFQATQLQLSSIPAMSSQVVTKGIRVGSLQQGGKLTSSSGASVVNQQSTHIQLYRQRQQLKVLQAATSGQQGQPILQAGGQTTLVNATGIIQNSLMQNNSGSTTVQVMQGGQKVTVAASNMSISGLSNQNNGAQVHIQQPHQSRPQFIKQVTGKQAITRQMGENEMLLVKRQLINATSHQKTAQVLQHGAQLFAATSTATVQLQQASSAAMGNTVQQQAVQGQSHNSSQQVLQQVTAQQVATLVKSSTTFSAGTGGGVSLAGASSHTQNTVNMALSQLKPGGQIKVTMANHSQMRQLHMQQHLAMPRKISRMTHIATAAVAAAGSGTGTQQVQCTTITQTNNSHQQQQQQQQQQQSQQSINATVTAQKISLTSTNSSNNSNSVTNNVGVPTQLVHIQNAKSLPSSVTVQQIQQVMRQGQPNAMATAGFVLGKTSVGRVIPVSMSSQPNQRQTIQVVSAASAQALAASNIRAHVTSGQNIAGAIKMAATGGAQSQSQQAIITAIQQQAAAQQNQRQNAGPVRLQTTSSGNLIAVVQQQAIQHQPQQQQSSHQPSIQNVVVNTSPSAVSANINGSNNSSTEVMTITQTCTGATITVTTPLQQTGIVATGAVVAGMNQQQSGASAQQVRTLMKKKIMQIRNEKE